MSSDQHNMPDQATEIERTTGGSAPAPAGPPFVKNAAAVEPLILSSEAAVKRDLPETAYIHPELAAEQHVLDAKNFSLFYGENQALHDVTVSVPKGKITALIGPSGCGKSTLLRSVNRLNDLIDGVRIKGSMYLNGDS